jgi:hypothetical protein
MKPRKYTNIKVLTRVRCMSDGYHWFTVIADGLGRDYYQPSIGFEKLTNAPKYLCNEVEHQIAQGFKENRFVIWERTKDDGERYAPDLRYHSQEMVDYYIERGERRTATSEADDA